MRPSAFLAILALLTAYASVTITPTIALSPQLTMRPTTTPKIDVLESPDGVIRANMVCYLNGMYSLCVTKFPGGETFQGVPDDWSPDNLYAVACIGATHDSPCRWFEVWDMVNGKKQAQLYTSYYCYMWSPTENHQLTYLYASVSLGENQFQLYALDAATGSADRLTTYPDWWFKPDRDVMGSACRPSLEVVVGSETPMFLTTPIPITPVPLSTPTDRYP